jgi:glycosidase
VSSPKDTIPNNWKTVYGQSAWEYDSTRQQWYYFSYLPEYPDLNLNNPEVLNKLDAILRFWLEKGVDGFNLVGLQRLLELNDTTKTESKEGEHTVDLPGNLDLVKRWRNIIDKYSDKPGREKALFGYVKADKNTTVDYSEAGIHVVSTDALIDLNLEPACDSDCLERNVARLTENKYHKGWIVGNEKTSRFGSRVPDAGLKKVYQVLHFLMPGTAIVYYGDEIAMTNGSVPNSKTVDPAAKRGLSSCDPYRTPMLWNNDENAGFCLEDVTPWLPVNADYSKDNVQFNSAHLNGFTILESFKALVKLRGSESFQWGETNFNVDGDIMYFTRKAEGFPGFLVAINRGKTASYNFASIADMMTLVYNSENTNVEEQFSMKDQHVAFKAGQIYVFQY